MRPRTGWVWYAIAAALVAALLVPLALQMYASRDRPLPVVTDMPENLGLTCEEVLQNARELAISDPGKARQTYLFFFHLCPDTAEMPHAMIEAASLLSYRLESPREARRVYTEFLGRFPTHPDASAAMLQLAKLELDAGNYASAVAHLTRLTNRYPNSLHEESARYLAERAAEMLASDRQSPWTILGQIRQLVPNNFKSILAILVALVPFAAKAIHRYVSGPRTGKSLALLLLLLVCLITNYFMNIVERSKQIERLEADILMLKSL